MADFVHLHNHSHYSLLDGACRIEDLVAAAKSHGMAALALTDHGNMFGAIEFYKACQKEGIKPIVGVEAYVAPRSRKQKSVAGSSVSDTSYHLVLLAKNVRGYQNLMQLVSIGYLEGFYYRPRLDRQALLENHEGLIALSACLKGEVAYKLLNESYEAARDTARAYREMFGDDYYLEIHNHGIPEEDRARDGILALSKELSIPVVATNDTHYLKREHYNPHDVLLCLQTGKDIDSPQRLRYTTDEIFFKSPDEMRQTFADFPDALSMTSDIAAKCDLHLDLNTFYLPKFEIPADHAGQSLDEYLAALAKEGMHRRYKTVSPEIEQRLQHELSVIQQTGYAGYFLIVQDFIAFAHSKGIPVGPGRGSAAGSLVSYCIGITNIDPLKYDLIFERFLNPERVTMPDIDIDFCYERRGEIIDYVRQKYGEQNVTQIITFGTMAARAVIRDVGRVLKIGYGDVDRIAKLIPATLGISLDEALNNVSELRALVEQSKVHNQLFEYAKVLEGLARHASTHAAGVVITPEELTKYTPLYKSNTGDVITQYDMKSLETVGVLKMDFLGLRTLTVMEKTIKMLKAKGITLDLDNLPENDPKTLQIFAEGETTAIFQFESTGMREYLKKLKPQSIDDLIAMNALYRPGPMEMIDDFIQRKHGVKKIEYLHPLLEPILKETYGVIVYQEQVMRIASEMAGFTLGGADLLRRAMGKKNAELMAKQRQKFIEGAKAKGVPENVATQVFALMDKFAGYGFNKSHAAGYSVVAYQTAFLKAHHPAEFMAATLGSEMSSSDRIVLLLDECRRMGLAILPPDINQSRADFFVEGGAIRFGLGAVKNVGAGAIESMVKARASRGPFKSIFDFCARVDLRLANKKVIESLIMAGAMDGLGGHRHQLLNALDDATAHAQKTAAQQRSRQASIFEQAPEAAAIEPPLPNVPAWPTPQILENEKATLGFYLSGHPLQSYAQELKAFSTMPLQDAATAGDGTAVMLCGRLSNVKPYNDRRGGEMAFVTLEDYSASVEGLVFADAFAANRELLKVDKIVVLLGRLSCREEELAKIIVERVLSLETAWLELPRLIRLIFDAAHLDKTIAARIAQLLRTHAGACDVRFGMRDAALPALDFASKTLKVRPSAELVQKLQVMLGANHVQIEAAMPPLRGREKNNGRTAYQQKGSAVQ
jgi:DNA polymerase-3 subunit alpha